MSNSPSNHQVCAELAVKQDDTIDSLRARVAELETVVRAQNDGDCIGDPKWPRSAHETKQTPSHDLECEHPPSFQKTVTTNSGTVTVCETCSESRFTPWQAEKASDDRDDTPEHLLKQGYRSGKVGDSK